MSSLSQGQLRHNNCFVRALACFILSAFVSPFSHFNAREITCVCLYSFGALADPVHVSGYHTHAHTHTHTHTLLGPHSVRLCSLTKSTMSGIHARCVQVTFISPHSRSPTQTLKTPGCSRRRRLQISLCAATSHVSNFST